MIEHRALVAVAIEADLGNFSAVADVADSDVIVVEVELVDDAPDDLVEFLLVAASAFLVVDDEGNVKRLTRLTTCTSSSQFTN